MPLGFALPGASSEDCHEVAPAPPPRGSAPELPLYAQPHDRDDPSQHTAARRSAPAPAAAKAAFAPLAGEGVSALFDELGQEGPAGHGLPAHLVALLRVPEELRCVREVQNAQERILEAIRARLEDLPDRLGDRMSVMVSNENTHGLSRKSGFGSLFVPHIGGKRPTTLGQGRASVRFQQGTIKHHRSHSALDKSRQSLKSMDSRADAEAEDDDDDDDPSELLSPMVPLDSAHNSANAHDTHGSVSVVPRENSVLTVPRAFPAARRTPLGRGTPSSSWRDSSTAASTRRGTDISEESDSTSGFAAGHGRRAATEEAVNLQLVSGPGDLHGSLSPVGARSLQSSMPVGRWPLSRTFMWKPNARIRLWWDAVAIAAIIITVVLAPIGLVYLDPGVLVQGSSLGWALHLADAVWLANIYMSFTTGFSEEGRLVVDFASTARRYIRSWLMVDLVSAYPFFLAPEDISGLSVLNVLKLTRLLRIVHLFSRLQRESRSTALLPVKIAVTVVLILHCLACFWRLAQGRILHPPDGLGWGDLYVKDFYWVLMTMTTIGYGDIVPQDTPARIYACATMLMSPLFFGSIVSGLTRTADLVLRDPVETKVAEAKRFMGKRGVSQALQLRVEHNLRQHIQQEKTSALDPELFGQLSPSIQRDLALELLSSTVLHFPLFKDAPYSFVSELATRFSWLLCMSGDIVVEEGQLVQEAYFVMRGRLYLESSVPETLQKHRIRMAEEGPLEFNVGAWFGEVCFFRSSATHDFTATAMVDTEVATLGSQDYHRIAEQYPRVAQQQRQLEKALEENRANLDQLAYKVHIHRRQEQTNLGSFFLRDQRLGSYFSRDSPRLRVSEGE